MSRILKIIGIAVLSVGLLFGTGIALGVLGTPSIGSVENRFGTVNETNTLVHTDLQVNNPNPVGVSLGGTTVNYTVAMNDVDIAAGTKEGISIESGNSTLSFTTAMDNEQIPEWWYTHIRENETTAVEIDGTATSSTLGGQSTSFGQEQTINTDIIGQFDSDETRPVDANQPLISDPVLYINSTRGSWDRANLTRQQTPMDLDFTVYNPKQVPYTVTKVGYNITMNDVPVGAGETERGYVIDPASTETIRADTAIRNENLDEWWVTHLQRNQVTDLYIDFYLIVEVQGEQFRVDMDSIDYEKQIETDIFGTKNASSSGSANSAGAETATPTQTDTDDGLLETSTETSLVNDSTEAGDSALDTETANGDLLTTVANSGTATPTETATDDGVL